MRWRMLVALMVLAATAVAQTPRVLTHFDAGSTVMLVVGETFVVRLEKKDGEPGAWRWRAIDRDVLTMVLDGDPAPPAATPGVEVTSVVFRAVGPGTIQIYAERVEAADQTRVYARYPLTVQVTVPEPPPATPEP